MHGGRLRNNGKNEDPPPRLGRSVAFVGGGIGDVIMHSAHFQAIATASAGNKVAIACPRSGPIAELYSGSSFVSEVIGIADERRGDNRIRVRAAVAKLRAGRFDSFFSLKSNPRMNFAAFLAGIPQRFGYTRVYDPRAMVLTRRVSVPRVTPHPLHMSKADMLLTDLGLKFDHAASRLHPNEQALSQAKKLITGHRAIAIGVNASVPQRQWGDRFIPLVQRLAAAIDVKFVLFGGRDVHDVAANIRTQSGLPAEKFIDLPQLNASLALSHAALSQCLLYVGNDSSGLNLAVFCGLPAIGFFTLAPPLTYSPLIIPLRPEPPGSGVEGVSIDRVYQKTIDTLRTHHPAVEFLRED